ncbi:chemerin-like receptor 1 [Latimeria chalumnae]|uniref:chemerin-like receptor 1 n=1 Tax=Latimeria chalumnae TaxID=7897 RepID=UPI00313D1248
MSLFNETNQGAVNINMSQHKQNLGSQDTIRYLNFGVCSLIFLFGLVGNGIVIWLTGFKVKRTESTIWFFNLATADFVFLLFLPLRVTTLLLNYWPFGLALCKTYFFMSTVNMYASAFILTAISIDRSISIAKPIWYRTCRPKHLTQKSCCLLWVLSATLSVPLLYYSTVAVKVNIPQCFVDIYGNDGPKPKSNPNMINPLLKARCNNTEYINSTNELCSFTASTLAPFISSQERILQNGLAVFLPIFLCGFLIPLVTITFSYSIIAFRVKYCHLPHLSRVYKVIFANVMSFFIAWTPSRVLGMLYLFAVYYFKNELLLFLKLYLPLASTFAYINSCINPILYVFISKKFKDVLKQELNVWLSGMQN